MRSSRWILVILFLCCGEFLLRAETQAPDFRKVSPFPTASTKFKGGIFGGGKFVVVGEQAIVSSTDNGVSWQEGTGYPKTNWNSVAYGNGKFVAVGQGTLVATSVDGVNWTAQNLPGTFSLSKVLFGNGVFVASGTPDFIFSQDGVSWYVAKWGFPGQQPTEHLTGTLGFASGVFATSSHLISTDGGAWSNWSGVIPEWLNPSCTTYGSCDHYEGTMSLDGGGGSFMCVVRYLKNFGGDDIAFSSIDTRSWSQLGNARGSSVIFVKDRFLFTFSGYWVDFNGNYASLPGTIQSFSWNDTSVLALGINGNIWRAANLSGPWSAKSPPEILINSAVSAGKVFVGVGAATNSAALVVSMEGLPSLSYVAAPEGSDVLKSVRYADGAFLAVGNGGTIVRSLDGTNWTRRLSNTASDLMDVAWGAGAWVAVGANGKIVSSADGDFFNLRFSGTELAINGVTFGNGKFVAVGRDGLVLSSTNGIDWAARGTGAVQELYAVTYGGGRFVATGTNGTVWVSPDALNWQSTTIAGVAALPRVAYGNGYYVATSSATNTFYYSTNGLSWTASTTTGASWVGVNFSAGELWLVGEKSGIWETSLSAANPPTLAGRFDGNWRFVVSLEAAVGGDYEIESTGSLPTSTWETAALLPDVIGSAAWTDTNQIGAMRFYRAVRK